MADGKDNTEIAADILIAYIQAHKPLATGTDAAANQIAQAFKIIYKGIADAQRGA